MESVLNNVDSICFSLRKRADLVLSGTAEDLSPLVRSVLSRGVASVAGTEESLLLAWIDALGKLRRAWGRYRKEHLRQGNLVEEIEFPEFRREQIISDVESSTPLNPSSPLGIPGDSDPLASASSTSGAGETPAERGNMVEKQPGDLEKEPAVERAVAGTLRLKDMASEFLSAMADKKPLLMLGLKSKHSQCVMLRALLVPLEADADWHACDQAYLRYVVEDTDATIKYVADLVRDPVPTSTPLVPTAPLRTLFPWNVSGVSTTSANPAGAQPLPGMVVQHPNVTAINLPTNTVMGALSGQGPPGQPGSSSGGSNAGGDPTQPDPSQSSAKDRALEAMFSRWYQKTTLSDLPTFEGKITTYLEWREQVVPLINLDTRGPIPTYITLRGLLKGSALEKVAHVRATDREAVNEMIRLLDETYLDQKLLVAGIKKEFYNIPGPDHRDPEALRSFVSKVASALRSFTEARRPPGMDVYDSVLDRIHLDLQKEYVKEVKMADRSIEAFLSWILTQADILAQTTHKAHQQASGKGLTNNAAKGGGNQGKGGTPQAHAATGTADPQPSTGGPAPGQNAGGGGGRNRNRRGRGGGAWGGAAPAPPSAAPTPAPASNGTPAPVAGGGGGTPGQNTGGPQG